MATAQRKDPFRTFNFVVEADGRPLGSFSEVSGLNADGDSVDYRTGDAPTNLVDKLPGLRKISNITLKRGLIQNRSMFALWADTASGNTRRLNITVTLRDEKRKNVLSWSCRNCWVNAIEGPSLRATDNQVAVESVTICHEGIDFKIE
jgi:phage tail-like protein